MTLQVLSGEILVARIPGPEGLSQGLSQITTDTRKQVYGRDTSTAGLVSAGLAGIAGEIHETQTREEVAKAQFDFQVMKTQEDAKYDADDDELTIEERYSGGIHNALGKASSQITDSAARAAFIDSSRPAIAQGQVKMKALVHKKTGDKQIAYMQNATALVHKGAIEGGDMGNAQIAVTNMWKSLAERGHISQVDAEAQIRESKFKMAHGYLKTMTPHDQIHALKSDWAEEIPLDVRIKLKKEAEAELLGDKALLTAHGWIQEGLTIDEANVELDAITDADEYELTRTRFFQMKNDEESGTQEMQKGLYDQHFAEVFFGDKKIADIPDIEAYSMSDSQLTNLQSAEIRAAKIKAGQFVKSYSDPVIKANLRGMVARGELQKAKTYFGENYAGLNDADYKYFETQVNAAAAKDPLNQSMRTLNQTMTTLLNGNGMKHDVGAQTIIWQNLTGRFNEYVLNNQRVPSKKEQEEWARDEFINIRRDPDAWFMDEDEYVYNMPPAERADFFEAADMLRQAHPGITRDEIVTKYEGMLSARKNAE